MPTASDFPGSCCFPRCYCDSCRPSSAAAGRVLSRHRCPDTFVLSSAPDAQAKEEGLRVKVVLHSALAVDPYHLAYAGAFLCDAGADILMLEVLS